MSNKNDKQKNSIPTFIIVIFVVIIIILLLLFIFSSDKIDMLKVLLGNNY